VFGGQNYRKKIQKASKFIKVFRNTRNSDSVFKLSNSTYSKVIQNIYANILKYLNLCQQKPPKQTRKKTFQSCQQAHSTTATVFISFSCKKD
jgi:hypothetical protein